MTVPLVSIKMITYNHAPFIARAIEGVLRQRTNFPFELIIGEDCSTDGTREIVFAYQKRYPDIIRVITSDKNVGMKNNGLRTLKAGKGKYLAFCEGDDHWHHPLKLQKQADHLDTHPECGLVYTNYDVYHVRSGKMIRGYIDHRKWTMPESMSIGDIVESRNGMARAIMTLTIMTRRQLCETIIEADPYLHQSDEFLMGDTQLWAEIAARSRVHYLPESTAIHNITDESATRSTDAKRVARFGMSGAKLQLYLCDKYGLPAPVRRKYEEYLLDCSLVLALHTNDRNLADEVRSKKKVFSLKEWFRYYGARSKAVYSAYRAAAFLPSVLRKRHEQWW